MEHKALYVFEGKIVRVGTGTITLPNGHQMEMEIVEHPGGAAVVALNGRDEICLLRQYRAVFDEWFWELPAGKRDNREPPLETAQRELLEEAGVVAENWQELGAMASSPGVFTERVYLYLATEIRLEEAKMGVDEVITETLWLPFDQACQWSYDGRISDAKSIIAILRAANKLGVGR